MQSLEALQSGAYKGEKRLKLCCDLSEVPKEVFELADTLEILDLSGNPISQLPDNFGALQRLKIAFFSDCDFSEFPAQLAQCRSLEMVAFKGNGMVRIPEGALPPSLRWLILTNNRIESLPRDIGKCHGLQKCMLAGNQLRSLPAEMADCRKLGLLRLSANALESLPAWLLQMPELAFLAFAGNPCAPALADNPVLDSIAWSELHVGALLGEGASGVISKAVWKGAHAGDREVAVKLFKGAVTSDGSPADEMMACMAAGSHPGLIDPLGRIRGHPDKHGLVLQLIPPAFTNLGLPPTLLTCTRDTYLPGTSLSLRKCRAILGAVGGAAMHLHARGIAHGDLYAHNILVDGEGNALLGDFGAATIYRGSRSDGASIERLEVLAFGHLVEDMLSLLDPASLSQDKAFVDSLRGLHARCTTAVVASRPSFAEVCGVLGSLGEHI